MKRPRKSTPPVAASGEKETKVRMMSKEELSTLRGNINATVNAMRMHGWKGVFCWTDSSEAGRKKRTEEICKSLEIVKLAIEAAQHGEPAKRMVRVKGGKRVDVR